MDPVVVSVFAFVYLGMILGEIPGLAVDRTGITIDWKTHARVGIPVCLATLAIAAAWLAL